MTSGNYTNILVEYFSCNHSMWTLRRNKAANVTEKQTVHLTCCVHGWKKRKKNTIHVLCGSA